MISDKQGFIKSEAFFQLLQLQSAITVGPEDTATLKRKCRVTQAGGADCIMYKEALALLQPNFALEHPLDSQWVIRNGERTVFATDQISTKTRSTVLSTFSGTKQDLQVRFKKDFAPSKPEEGAEQNKPTPVR